MQFTPRPYQTAAINSAVHFFQEKKHYNAIEVLPTGCHAKGTRILMYDGTVKAVENIQVGDQIMGPDSFPREVLNLCGGREMMYEVNPLRGGAPFNINAGHVLHLVSTNEGRDDYKCYQRGGEVCNISVKDYLTKSKSWKHLRKLKRAEVIQFQKGPSLPVHPWVLGIIIGDGSTMNGVVCFTTMDEEISSEMCSYIKKFGCTTREERKKNTKATTYKIIKSENKTNRMFRNNFFVELEGLGITGKYAAIKFIPEIYKTASVNDRLEILAGIIDSDGHYDRSGDYDFVSKSSQLANDVVFIARSLGLRASISKCQKSCQTGMGGFYYRVNISGDISIIPCRVSRKKAKPRGQKKNCLVTGFKISEAGYGEYFGFTLDKDHLYLTADFTIHHNSGKSVVIANIAKELQGNTVVFQPSKEILEQNYAKFTSYGYRASIYSASLGQRHLDKVTFATIGSVAKKPHIFREFKNIIVDECHLVNPEEGMYHRFIKTLGHAKVLGLTATPYRLTSGFEGAQLRWLTRTSPRIFNKVLYYVQNNVLFDAGHLAPLEYYSFNKIDRTALQMNSTGTDFTEASLRSYYRQINMPKITIDYARQILTKKKNLLIFSSLIEEAMEVQKGIPGSVVITGDTDPVLRARLLSEFKSGKIRCVINVGVLTTGFDYPELEAVLIARSTMSLALYYQIVGRVMRPFTYPDGTKKTGWVVDLGGNIDFFGKIETMEICQDSRDLFFIRNLVGGRWRQLTNVTFSKN